jgi:mRNA-degrading endonuclease RelE of RelBE toxin-antitoxin system
VAKYHVRYVTYANEQLGQLPQSLRTAFDIRIEDLKEDPYVAGDYNEVGSYSTTFGETGIILYTVSDEITTVTILRVTWVQM